MKVYFVLLVGVCSTAIGDDGILSSQTDNRDKTGRFFDVLADFVVNHDLIEKQRYAVLSSGKVTEIHPKYGVTTKPLRHIAASDGDERLDASAITLSSSSRALSTIWIQEFRDGKNIFRRHRDSSTRTYADEKERDDKEVRYVAKLNPAYQAVCSPSGLVYRGTAKTIGSDLFDYRLESCEYTDDGDIVATLTQGGEEAVGIPSSKHRNLVRRVIVFGSKSGFMPVESRLFVKADSRIVPNAKLRLIAHATTNWSRRKSGIYLPAKYSGATFHPATGVERAQYELAYRWAIGGEVPKGILDVNAPDWRYGVESLLGAD